jgi:hypothetical protein
VELPIKFLVFLMGDNMAEDLSKLWKNISLSEEESLGVEAITQGCIRQCPWQKLFGGKINF